MHYANGREAKNGDKIVVVQSDGTVRVGILYNAVAGNDTCNGRIAQMRHDDPWTNLQECLALEDVMKFVGDLKKLPDSSKVQS